MLLGAFVAFAFATVVSAQTLTFRWPKYPEASVEFSLTWSGGTPPYTVYVLTPDLTKYYFKYQGSDVSTTYNFALPVGTEVAFQCRDSAGLIVTSSTITVIATLNLQYPRNLQTGVSTNIQWGDGLSPYTAYVLTPDQTRYYWKYTGSDTSQNWTPDMDAGTQVLFQVIDLNGVNVTSNIVTVQGNGDASKSSLSVLSTMSVASVNSVAHSSSFQNTSSIPLSTPGGTGAGTGGGGSSTQSNGGRSTGVRTTTSSQPAQTAGAGGAKKGSVNVAAIAGGVGGGVAGLGLIALLIFFLVNRGVAKAETNNDEHGKPTREPALPSVGLLAGEYTPDAGAGANLGGVHGVGGGKTSFTPELPGAYYQINDHNQGGARYSIPTSGSPPSTDGNHPMSAAYPSGLQQPRPQSTPYGLQAAGAAFAATTPARGDAHARQSYLLPSNHGRSTPSASPGFPSPMNPPVSGSWTSGGPGTSSPDVRTLPHGSGMYSASRPASSSGRPLGWAGLPEVQ